MISGSSVKINNCTTKASKLVQVFSVPYTINIKLKRGAKIFEREIASIWLKLCDV